MKRDLTIAGIRSLPMPDPDTGQMTTLDAYARKLAVDAGARGSLGEDPVATAYMMLFDSNFLTDQARVIQLPDGKYGTLTEAINTAAGDPGGGLNEDVLKPALTAAADLHQAQGLGSGELLSKALNKFFFAVSEANASRGGAGAPATSAVARGAKDAARSTPAANAGTASRERTIDLGNGVRMAFVLIPAGDFHMGSPSGEKDRRSAEGPVRRVQITKAFLMGKFEVTQDQYNAVMGRNPSHFSGTADLPVETVSWLEATAFCTRLSTPSRGHFRLPTEAEWEYACRAGTESRFYYGDDLNYKEVGEYAWYAGNSKGRTHGVGQKKPNQFGLHDMYGNVWEWCSDYYDYGDGYKNLASIDPQGATSGIRRVIRGGECLFGASSCRSASRYWAFWEIGADHEIGFRVVLDLE